MADSDDQHHDSFLLNFTDDSVIPDSVTPETLVGVAQRFAKALGIVGGRDPRLHILEDLFWMRLSRPRKSLSTRGSYSIVQAKVLSQLMRRDGCLPIL